MIRSGKTLAIDVGGTHLKATVLDQNGKMMREQVKVDTPHPCPPDQFLKSLDQLTAELPSYERVSIGFPGVVSNGHIMTAANLGEKPWQNYDLAAAVQKKLHKPVRIENDADVQGLAAIKGDGIELVITLGTGFGTALFKNGVLGPHLELAHHPFRKSDTYEDRLGEAARKDMGNRKWEKQVYKAIIELHKLTHFKHIYIGGGNAQRLHRDRLPRGIEDFGPVPPKVHIVPNADGILGGHLLWENRHTTETRAS